MKKIITAIGKPDLNRELKELDIYEIVSKDIQYKEGIIEILESVSDVDIVILKEDIPGEKSLKEIVIELLYIKNDLEIIIFLKNNDIELISFLNSEGIFKIYSDEKINLESIIKSLENIEENIINEQIASKSKTIAVSGVSGVRKKCVFSNFS